MAGIETQVLSTGETFASLPWMVATAAGVWPDEQPPYLLRYYPLDPSESWNSVTGDGALSPLRPNFTLSVATAGRIYKPDPTSPAGSIPVLVASAGTPSNDVAHGFLARDGSVAAHDGLSVEAEFELRAVGGSTQGALTQGTGGTSPTRQAQRRIPTSDPSGSSSTENTTLAFSASANTSGPLPPATALDRVPLANGWRGNGVYIRAGGGRPLIQDGTGDDYSIYRMDHYIFVAYPVLNGSTPDLYLELWRNNYDLYLPIYQHKATLLAKQVVPNAAMNIQFDRSYRLRVEVVNVAGDPTFTAYIGDYKQAGVVAEMQAFKDGVFTSSTISTGPSGDGSINTTTGIVTDSGAEKITGNADKTFGVHACRERTIDLSAWSSSYPSPTPINVIEGLRRITVKRTDTDAIVYNDLFERSPGEYYGNSASEAVDGLFNFGTRADGAFLFDGSAETDFAAGDFKIRRLLATTDTLGADTTKTDYVTAYIDPDPGVTGYASGVGRFFVDTRPSTQFYNHHRGITVTGATDSTSGVFNVFLLGVAARGSMQAARQDSVAFVAEYVTDGAGAQTYLRLKIVEFHAWLWDDLNDVSNYSTIASVEVQASGAGIPVGYDMTGTHDLALKAEVIPTATTPTSAAQYTAYFDGAAVAFDTFASGVVQDATSKVVTDNSPTPNTTSGRSEAFFWYSQQPAETGGGVANYVPPRFTDWVEGTLTDDPVYLGPRQSVAVAGEGSPSVNFSTALDAVDWEFHVESYRPRYEATFASGHRYTSPQWGKARRVIVASAENLPKTTLEAVVSFYNARSGVGEAFYLNDPIPASMSAETPLVLSAVFASDALDYRREAEGVYSVRLTMIEVF